MKTKYQQLTLKERYQIEILSTEGKSARSIAKQLGRGNRTISNELRRCTLGAYCAETAHTSALKNRQQAFKCTKITDDIVTTVKSLLNFGLSPEQVSGRMKQEKTHVRLSTNTIYSLVKQKGLEKLLPRSGKPYKQRQGAEAGVRLIPDRVDISERPAVVDKKVEIGHWEGDTVHGKDCYLVTLVERVSKCLLVKRVKSKSKADVTKAINSMLKPFRGICKTITFDNGGEFAGHKSVSKALKCDVYFAKPYHSWQRGLNENTNGLLRRFFPKGMAIGSVCEQEIKNAEFSINTRPRKALNYLSPYEFLTGKRVSLITEI